jgi:hypothetical protein
MTKEDLELSWKLENGKHVIVVSYCYCFETKESKFYRYIFQKKL